MSTGLDALRDYCIRYRVPTTGWVPWGGDYIGGADYWRRYDELQHQTHTAVVHLDDTVEIYELTPRPNGTCIMRAVNKGASA